MFYRFLLSFIICTLTYGFQAGLKLPSWYTGRLSIPKVPVSTESFQIIFNFTPTLADIDKIEGTLTLPPSSILLEGTQQFTLSDLKKNQPVSYIWKLQANPLEEMQNIHLAVTLPIPRQELAQAATNLYSSEPLHQQNALKNKIKKLNDSGEFYFHSSFFCSDIESFLTAPSYLFHQKMSVVPLSSVWLMQNAKEVNPNEALKTVLQSETKMNPTSPDPQWIKIQAQNPSFAKKIIQDTALLYQDLCITLLKNKNYTLADQKIQDFGRFLLQQKEVDLDLFLSVQNMRAFALVALKDQEKAKTVLISAIRNAPSSSVKHYLLYNLSLIHEAEKNSFETKRRLREAILANPGFTLAIKHLEKQ